MKTKNAGKIFFRLLTILLVVVFSASPVLAVKIPSPSKVARDMEKRYHLNLDTLRDMSHSLNVGGEKATAPQVMLFFNPSDPREGEKITAEALPLYFITPKHSMYYTWYLKRKACKEKNGGLNPTEKNVCDLDKDGRIDYNDWKIEAHRIIANNDWDISKGNYSEASAGDDKDKDGYRALWGGNDRDPRLDDFLTDYNRRSDNQYTISGYSSGNAYCYIHDFVTGKSYELRETGQTSVFDCPSGTSPKCVEDEEIICPGTVSAGGGTGGDAIGTTFDQYRICTDLGEPYCEVNSNPDTSDNPVSGTAVCTSGRPICVSASPPSYSCDMRPSSYNAGSCTSLYALHLTPSCTVEKTDVSKAGNSCRHLFPSYRDFRNNITYSGYLDTSSKNVGIDLNNEAVGDGRFSDFEEIFWNTNPRDADTADNGNKDEANIVGLGLNSFTWNYQEGDMVGVAVEGSSMTPTQHEGSSMMIMWALPNNKCEPKGKSEYKKVVRGYPVTFLTANNNINECLKDNLVDPRQGGQAKKIDVSLSYTPKNPLNDPSAQAMGDTLIVQALSTNADQESAQIYYEWKVQIIKGGLITSDLNAWKDITSKLLEKKLISGPARGNNLSSLAINMNLNDDIVKTENDSDAFDKYLSDGIGYLKVSVIMSENVGSDETREGRSSVIVKFNSSEQKIGAYMAQVDDNNKLTFGRDPYVDPICESYNKNEGTSISAPVCMVVKNDIIGLKVDNEKNELENFYWTVNGKPLYCNKTISDLCDDQAQNNVNFFPVPDSPGKIYNVAVTAVNTGTGQSINLSRNFQVVEPFVKIAPIDSGGIVWPKYLGSYKDLEGKSPDDYEDYSEIFFETEYGSNFEMFAEFHPSWLGNFIEEGLLQMEWKVDGVPVEGAEYHFENESGLTIVSKKITIKQEEFKEKSVGDVYSISLRAVFNQNPEIRQALWDFWQITPYESAGKHMEADVQVEILDSTKYITKGPGRYLASLLSNFPSQMAFLFRILLTICVILVVTGAVFSLTPDPYESKKMSS